MNAKTQTTSFTSPLCLLMLCAASLLTGCPDFGETPESIDVGTGSGSGAREFTYCADIKPIFDASCARCHGAGPEGGQYPDLDVYTQRPTRFGGVATDIDSSLRRINIGDMPPRGEPDPAVTRQQRAIIEAWKAQGMPEGSCN